MRLPSIHGSYVCMTFVQVNLKSRSTHVGKGGGGGGGGAEWLCIDDVDSYPVLPRNNLHF